MKQQTFSDIEYSNRRKRQNGKNSLIPWRKFLILLTVLLVAGIAVAIIVTRNTKNDVNLQGRTYVFETPNMEDSAYITIDGEHTFQFIYSQLSSYRATGKYTVQGNEIHCKTDDGKFEYVFIIDGETLIFNQQKSSKLPTYSKIEDGVVFE